MYYVISNYLSDVMFHLFRDVTTLLTVAIYASAIYLYMNSTSLRKRSSLIYHSLMEWMTNNNNCCCYMMNIEDLYFPIW
jgi:hypothetical protein